MARGFKLLLIRASVVFKKGFTLFAYPYVRSFGTEVLYIDNSFALIFFVVVVFNYFKT